MLQPLLSASALTAKRAFELTVAISIAATPRSQVGVPLVRGAPFQTGPAEPLGRTEQPERHPCQMVGVIVKPCAIEALEAVASLCGGATGSSVHAGRN
jgi:hypothetical protein